jgi:hypothetical protein|tara:strand:- start:447 stop:566 length:120 start_codon:yes stop_codon:yes gene_type:complete
MIEMLAHCTPELFVAVVTSGTVMILVAITFLDERWKKNK